MLVKCNGQVVTVRKVSMHFRGQTPTVEIIDQDGQFFAAMANGRIPIFKMSWGCLSMSVLYRNTELIYINHPNPDAWLVTGDITALQVLSSHSEPVPTTHRE